MSRILITGSTDGLGKLAAIQLINQGHRVVIHARNVERKNLASHELPGAENILIADLSNVEETKNLAHQANSLGRFDAVIHNAGIYQKPNAVTFAVNSLAPYILTCAMEKPERLIYLSSGLHMHGKSDFSIKTYNHENFNYSDTKLQVILLCKAISRKWHSVYANAVNPGWVPTKMGGPAAPDDLMKGMETQVWLATSNDPDARVSGRYFFHRQEKQCHPAAADISLQEKFLSLCEQITSIRFSI